MAELHALFGAAVQIGGGGSLGLDESLGDAFVLERTAHIKRRGLD